MATCRIVVPVYNEADSLEQILQETLAAGYLHRISFVNDASTDNSEDILRRWQETQGVNVVHLDRNRRKEGAIREVLERLRAQEALPDFICLLDADSVIQTEGRPIDEVLAPAIREMQRDSIAGLALRIEARIDRDSNVLQRCIYIDYSAVQFDNWITAKQSQLWVVNGPGGLFRSRELLDALRRLTPDFETGDLQISVNLMKQGLRLGFYPGITVQTAVPRTLSTYFSQRRRWERGTTKVLWADRRFYSRQFLRPRILALFLLIHLSLYPGLGLVLTAALIYVDTVPLVTVKILYVTLLWYVINTFKVMTNRYVRKGPHYALVPVWAIWNGLLWLFVTWTARLAGFLDAISYLAGREQPSVENPVHDI